MTSETTLKKFGFTFGVGGVHSARTMAFDELELVLDTLPVDTNKEDYYNYNIFYLFNKTELCLRKAGSFVYNAGTFVRKKLIKVNPAILLGYNAYCQKNMN